jgi:lysophospholipase L1-like esterase
MNHRCIAALALLAAACGCGSGPTPIANPPQIACPADVTVRGVLAPPQPVSFEAPTATGGTGAVNVTCARESGSTFPLGSTPVSCMARDAAGRQATCTFNVTVTGIALGVTTFEAVGDSFTEGENALPLTSFVDSANAYPTKLQALLDAAYPGQATVLNKGHGGDEVEETVEMLPGLLIQDRPGAVLLLSGYNDLTLPCEVGNAGTAACEAAIEEVRLGVRSCIRRANESPVGVKHVFVATLTPPGPVSAESRDRRIDGDAIVRVNGRIRQVVASERATLVDLHPLFLGREAEYISIDGLHLTPAGYQAIADAFFAAIKATVEQTPLVTTR